MSVYLVTWDLNKEKPNYSSARTKFISDLDVYENTKDPGLDSVRFISTDWSAEEIYNDLSSTLDKNDRLFITKIKDTEYYGFLSQSVWDWINKQ